VAPLILLVDPKDNQRKCESEHSDENVDFIWFHADPAM
jgi:hypothetical protein